MLKFPVKTYYECLGLSSRELCLLLLDKNDCPNENLAIYLWAILILLYCPRLEMFVLELNLRQPIHGLKCQQLKEKSQDQQRYYYDELKQQQRALKYLFHLLCHQPICFLKDEGLAIYSQKNLNHEQRLMALYVLLLILFPILLKT